MTFKLELEAFAKKCGDNADLVIKKVIIDLGTSLVEKSPVGDAKYWKKPPPPGYVGGRFRGNWQYGLNAVNATTTEAIDPSGSATIETIVGKVEDKASGNIHYLTNSLPYAQRLEEGWSRQAPAGFVILTTIEFQFFINDAVKGLP